MPFLAPVFMACGIGLLYTASRERLSPASRVAMVAFACVPFIALVANFALARVWTGVSSYSILVVAMLLVAARTVRERGGGHGAREEGRDLFLFSAAAMVLAGGVGFLLFPHAFPAHHYPLLRPVMAPLGAVMTALAVLVLWSERRGGPRGPGRFRAVLLGFPLLALACNFYVVRIWTGVALYGLWAAGALLSPVWGRLGFLLAPAAAAEGAAAGLDRVAVKTVESASWLLAIFLVGMFSLQPLVHASHLVPVAVAILFMALFNLLWLRLGVRFTSAEKAMTVQMAVLTALFGFLMFVTGGLYSHFATLLLIPVFMAALTLIPAAPWGSGAVAFVALLLDAMRDMWASSVSPYGAISLVVFHTLPLVVGTAVSWVIACRMRSYLDSLEAAKEDLQVKNSILENLAMTDPVTGLHNHRYFQERLNEELARAAREGRPLALAIVDLDRFKNVNDTYGHQAGDFVLRQVGDILRTGLRDGDVVARYGGEEFAVILPGLNRNGAWTVIDRLRKRVAAREMRLPDGRTLRVTCSAGVADFPDGAPDRESLVTRADLALYRAKALGRNRVEAADDSQVPAVERSSRRAYHV